MIEKMSGWESITSAISLTMHLYWLSVADEGATQPASPSPDINALELDLELECFRDVSKIGFILGCEKTEK